MENEIREYTILISIKEKGICFKTENNVLLKSSLKELESNLKYVFEDLIVPNLSEVVEQRREISKRKLHIH